MWARRYPHAEAVKARGLASELLLAESLVAELPRSLEAPPVWRATPMPWLRRTSLPTLSVDTLSRLTVPADWTPRNRFGLRPRRRDDVPDRRLRTYPEPNRPPSERLRRCVLRPSNALPPARWTRLSQ